jgi:hypothetical protein
MKFSPAPKGLPGLFLTFLLFMSTSAFAGNPLITASFSGIWDQPEQESQGIILQIAESNDDKVGIAYWFTYGPDLKTSWYLGVGDVTGDSIAMVLYTVSDVGFMAENLEDADGVSEVGTLDLVFKNCNHGVATYEFFDVEGVTEADAGEFPIKRISSIYRQRCSGGISDDTPAGGKPLDLDVDLLPARDDITGKGKAKFWERSARIDFKVEAEDIPDDIYSLEICGGEEDPPVETVEFEFVVTGGEGELEFRSPETDDKLFLNFDPRGCKIEIIDGVGVALTSGDEVLSEKKTGKPDHEDGIKIVADLTNTDVMVGAEGEAEFEIDADETEFSVKIKDVSAPGLYSVWVDGDNVGDIEVEDDGEFDGKTKFTDPLKAGTSELTFDPRGKTVAIQQGDGQVILTTDFPLE